MPPHQPQPNDAASDDAFCHAARAPADALWAQKRERADAAHALYAAGDKAGAKAASDAAHALEARALQADAGAARTIFAHKQARVGANEIDLHGLRVDEARRFLAARLDSDAAQGRGGALVVIYGQGHHSADKKAHVQPAALALLAERGLAARAGWDEARARE